MTEYLMTIEMQMCPTLTNELSQLVFDRMNAVNGEGCSYMAEDDGWVTMTWVMDSPNRLDALDASVKRLKSLFEEVDGLDALDMTFLSMDIGGLA